MKHFKIIKSSRPFVKKPQIENKLRQFKIPLRLFKEVHSINYVNKIYESENL